VVDAARDAKAALQLAGRSLYNLVISDVKMPGMSGLELLAQIRERNPDTLFILMTAFSTVENAVAAMRLGAYDYLPKPIDLKRLRVLVQKALEHQAVVVENHELRSRLEKRSAPATLIGESESMRAVARLIEEVAHSDVTVLIEGESGTGKEIAARLIHTQSQRHDQPFISVNCAAFAEQLLEAELFGHVKGAFTGATAQKPGRFQATCRPKARVICCACSKTAPSAWSAAPNSFASMSASSPPPTKTCRRRWPMENSAKTSSTGSTSCPSSCRHCASGRMTSRC
jgi:DNA-binding NtrC family response regulator